MATPSSDHHRQTVIEWLDRLQSSVRSPPVRSGPAKNPFQLDTHAGDSEESDYEQRQRQQQQHAQPRRASSGSDDSPLSPNTLVEAEIDQPDEAVPIGLLAQLAISTLRDDPNSSEKKGKGGENADDDDVVRPHSCHPRRIRLTTSLLGSRRQAVFHAWPIKKPRLAQVPD